MLMPGVLHSEADTLHYIKVHFLHGSKPGKGHKGAEMKYFGGLHGGHVTIEVDSTDYGFNPSGRFHIFPHKHKRHSAWVSSFTAGMPVYSEGNKVTTIIIPLHTKQYTGIRKVLTTYDEKTPYDYAFFGMRCAAAVEDVLGQIGVLRDKTKFRNVCSTFYPKKLRRRLLELAEEKKWKVERQEGRKTRKWEND